MQYAVVLLKPDAVRDRLEPLIENDLEGAGCHILLRKYWGVQTQQIQIIHPDLAAGDPYTPYMLRNYSRGLSLVLLLQYEGTEDIHIYLRKLKGTPETLRSIRFRYPISVAEWEDSEFDFNNVVNRRMVENRIHTPDNVEETIAVLGYCLSPPEMFRLPEALRNSVMRFNAAHQRP